MRCGHGDVAHKVNTKNRAAREAEEEATWGGLHRRGEDELQLEGRRWLHLAQLDSSAGGDRRIQVLILHTNNSLMFVALLHPK